ncbi:hypothetical protein ACHAPD_010177 [Fusarium lateritium]
MSIISVENESSSLGAGSVDPSTMGSIEADPGLLSSLGLSRTFHMEVTNNPHAEINPDTSTGSTSEQTPLDLGLTGDAGTSMSFPSMGTEGLDFDPAWMDTAASNIDWRYLDISLAHSHDAGRNEDTGHTWIERAPPLEEMNIMGSGNWIPNHPGSS